MTEPQKNKAVVYRVSDGQVLGSFRRPLGKDVEDVHTPESGEAWLFGQYVDRPRRYKVASGILEEYDPPDTITLEQRKLAAKQDIDRGAGYVRGSYASMGFGQEMTYLAKETEANTCLADTSPSPEHYPMLSAEVGITASTLSEVATIIANKAAEWRSVSATIEAIRLSSKQAVDNASTEAEISRIINDLSWPLPE